jgi:hypothetical protein
MSFGRAKSENKKRVLTCICVVCVVDHRWDESSRVVCVLWLQLQEGLLNVPQGGRRQGGRGSGRHPRVEPLERHKLQQQSEKTRQQKHSTLGAKGCAFAPAGKGCPQGPPTNPAGGRPFRTVGWWVVRLARSRLSRKLSERPDLEIRLGTRPEGEDRCSRAL